MDTESQPVRELHPSVYQNYTGAEDQPLPAPRLQFRWESFEPSEEEERANPDAQHFTRCHHEYVLPPRDYCDDNGQFNERVLLIGSSVVYTNVGPEPNYTLMDKPRPQKPMQHNVQPEYFNNSPVYVISQYGTVWKIG